MAERDVVPAGWLALTDHDRWASGVALEPLHVLRSDCSGRPIGVCRFLDWELARRWFLPAWLDDTPFVEAEHFNWSLFVHAVMTEPGRRTRIGPARVRACAES